MTTFAPDTRQADAADWDDVLISLGLEPSAPKRPRGRGSVAQCGTPSGSTRHYNLGEPRCEPCRLAKNAANREQHAARQRGDTPKPKPESLIKCGTHQGADRHRRRKEPVCDPCRTAYNAWQSEYRASRTQAVTR